MPHFDPSTDFKWLLAVPLIPLVGYVVQIFFGRRLPRQGDWLLTGGMGVVMAITVWMAAKAIAAAYAGEEFSHHSSEAGMTFSWLYQEGKPAGSPFNVTAGILYDGLGAAMLAVVGIVSFFVHLFSIGYMRGDRRYPIFFANISLFTVAMLGLVLSDNILFLFVFWELMGLMSYLLIGHFSQDPSSPRITHAAKACKKAFMTTRIGDTCLMLGMIMFYAEFRTFHFEELWAASRAAVEANGGDFPAWMTIAGLLVFGGTVGKSAQFPLHVWLPDAMEGPTPVSAMIHAATMVAAGVFLLGRTYPMMSPEVLTVVTVVGALTALFAATIGTTVFDIKGVLAYSTISQLGFMVAAVGLGGVVAGMFHMVTHAFFKACLFLCAGSVIHGCHHEQDMRKMGGLRKLMPVTFACMLVSTLAIAGIPLFAGFYSKDMIILQAVENSLGHMRGADLFAAIALPLAALLTAFYMSRLIFMTFFGEYRGGGDHAHAAGHDAHAHAAGHHAHASDHGGHGHEDEHGHDHGHDHGHGHADDGHAGAHHGHAHVPHESPLPITLSLVALAILGVLGGHFWLADGLHALAFWQPHETWFQKLFSVESSYAGLAQVQHVDEHTAHLGHTLALGISLFVALAGILLAWRIYGRGWERSQRITGRITAGLGEIYHLVRNKYFVDELLVDGIVVRGTLALATIQRWLDENVVDGLVNAIGLANKTVGFLSAWFDRAIVDGAVNLVGATTQTFGSVARLFQTGRIQQYVSFAVAGGLAAAAWLILS